MLIAPSTALEPQNTSIDSAQKPFMLEEPVTSSPPLSLLNQPPSNSTRPLATINVQPQQEDNSSKQNGPKAPYLTPQQAFIAKKLEAHMLKEENKKQELLI